MNATPATDRQIAYLADLQARAQERIAEFGSVEALFAVGEDIERRGCKRIDSTEFAEIKKALLARHGLGPGTHFRDMPAEVRAEMFQAQAAHSEDLITRPRREFDEAAHADLTGLSREQASRYIDALAYLK